MASATFKSQDAFDVYFRLLILIFHLFAVTMHRYKTNKQKKKPVTSEDSDLSQKYTLNIKICSALAPQKFRL